MDLPFMKKKAQEQVIPGRGFVPVDRVREMASRGFSEPEMIDILRRDGFSADEVDKALTQALRIGVMGDQQPQPPTQQWQQMQQPQQQQQWQPTYQRPQQEDFKWPSEKVQPQQQQQQWQPQPQQQQGTPSGLPTLDSIAGMQPTQESMPQIPETSLPESYYSQYPSEDYIDYIVQQRLSEVNDRVHEFQAQYHDLQKKIDDLDEAIRNMTMKSNPNQSQFQSKMETFSDTVSDVDNRLSGLEKAFKETLPELIDSVRALNEVVQRVKKD